VHVGPPIQVTEIVSAREFLRQSDFSPASDYFSRLTQIQYRLERRSKEPVLPPAKHNYGGEAAGFWVQLQSAYDHVILSTCYDGDFNFKHGRVKISHRFNQQGRIDFVELKFLRSLDPLLDGAFRKLLTVKDYSSLPTDWRGAEAFLLQVLPRELIFLHPEIFRHPRSELCAWLVNIGHRLVRGLVDDLKTRPLNGSFPYSGRNGEQLCMLAVRTDEIAWPILEKTALLESVVEITGPKTASITYLSARSSPPGEDA